MDSHKQQQTRN